MTELERAIRDIRAAGLTVTLVEGEDKSALWDCGPLKKVGYYEVLRLAKKMYIPMPQADASMFPIRDWPDMPKDAFR